MQEVVICSNLLALIFYVCNVHIKKMTIESWCHSKAMWKDCWKAVGKAKMQMLPDAALLLHIQHIQSNKNKFHKILYFKCAERCRISSWLRAFIFCGKLEDKKIYFIYVIYVHWLVNWHWVWKDENKVRNPGECVAFRSVTMIVLFHFLLYHISLMQTDFPFLVERCSLQNWF